MTTRDQALGGEFEHGAQLLRGTEIGHQFGQQDQFIVPAQVVLGGEDVTLDHRTLSDSRSASARMMSANFGVISTTSTG